MTDFSFQCSASLSAAIAAGLCGWIAIRTSGVTGLPGCGEGSDCETVASSRWSGSVGIPVAWIGTGVYLLLAVLSLLCNRRLWPQPPALMDGAAISIAFVVIGSVAWFVFLQLAVLPKICPYCNAVHLFGLASSLIILSDHRVSRSFNGPILVALTGLLLLIVGQILWVPNNIDPQDTLDQVKQEAEKVVDGAIDSMVIDPDLLRRYAEDRRANHMPPIPADRILGRWKQIRTVEVKESSPTTEPTTQPGG